MKLKVLFPAVAFLFAAHAFRPCRVNLPFPFSGQPRLRPERSLPVFPEVDEDEEDVDYTRTVDEN